jgi:hypothetical protein
MQWHAALMNMRHVRNALPGSTCTIRNTAVQNHTVRDWSESVESSLTGRHLCTAGANIYCSESISEMRLERKQTGCSPSYLDPLKHASLHTT